MPAPITVRDPSIYEAQRRPSSASQDIFRNFITAASGLSSESSITATERNKHHMVDISMSPRLFGYLICCISCAVSALSSFVFLARGRGKRNTIDFQAYYDSLGITLTDEAWELANERVESMGAGYRLYGTGGHILNEWKVYGCIAISGLLAIITASIVIAHFDSKLCVKLNRSNFDHGSKFERNLLLVLTFLSAVGLYINTSRFSVGEAQVNVFFSTWTNFISCCVNYEVWRKGCGRHFTFRKVIFGHRRHWFLLAILCTIAFLSTLDFYLENGRVQGSRPCTHGWVNKWTMFSFLTAVVSWAVVLLHRYCNRRIVVRVLEFIASPTITASMGFAINRFTGGRLESVPCPSNLYFSLWGAFFTSVWILSTLIQKDGLSDE